MHDAVREIENENNWRDKDFAYMKKEGIRTKYPRLWNQMCVLMIYAHWEGFVSTSLKIVLSHLNKMQLSHSQICTRMTVLSLADSYSSLKGKQSFEQRVQFTDKFYEILSKGVRFQTKVNTKSNLNYKVLQELCSIFGFNFANFSPYKADINRLVRIRNSIAHGENGISIDQKSILTKIEIVKNCFSILEQEIEIFFAQKKYLCVPQKTNLTIPLPSPHNPAS